jgi:hypothetical protein
MAATSPASSLVIANPSDDFKPDGFSSSNGLFLQYKVHPSEEEAFLLHVARIHIQAGFITRDWDGTLLLYVDPADVHKLVLIGSGHFEQGIEQSTRSGWEHVSDGEGISWLTQDHRNTGKVISPQEHRHDGGLSASDVIATPERSSAGTTHSSVDYQPMKKLDSLSEVYQAMEEEGIIGRYGPSGLTPEEFRIQEERLRDGSISHAATETSNNLSEIYKAMESYGIVGIYGPSGLTVGESFTGMTTGQRVHVG